MKKWDGCYDSSWKGVITDASFAHPAKFSRGLIERIFDYCLKQGYLKVGDEVGDCFGGIGSGGITAAYRGLHWIGCELEPRFVAMAEDNFKLHQHRWKTMGKPWPRIIQGDSRAFHVLLGEDYEAMVSSPPYADSVNKQDNGIDWEKTNRPDRAKGASHKRNNNSMATGDFRYGDASGQIGSLSAGAVDSVIASPPFSQPHDGGGGINKKGYQKRPDIAPDFLGSRTYQGRGGDRTVGNIETLKEGQVEAVVSSPPYSDTSPEKFGSGIDTEKLWVRYRQQGGGLSLEGFKKHKAKHSDGYGRTCGQISQLKGGTVDAVATSPPYAPNDKHDHQMSADRKTRRRDQNPNKPQGRGCFRGSETYGDSEGQIGREGPETYWQAMDAVYRSCHKAIKPNGFLILVLKDYVKGGKRVPLCDDTCRLIEHVGFEVIERIQAMLVSETSHGDLFNGTDTKTKSRKSFFRRLAEKKGSPKIDFEEVIIARKLDPGIPSKLEAGIS